MGILVKVQGNVQITKQTQTDPMGLQMIASPYLINPGTR
jgi:hypothetical protein